MTRKYKLAAILLIILLSVLLLAKPIYRRMVDISINCYDHSVKTYCYEQNYYFLQNDGIYLFSENEDRMIIDINNCLQFIVDDKYIYCFAVDLNDMYYTAIYDKENGKEIMRHSFFQNRICFLGTVNNFLICCKSEQNGDIKNVVAYNIYDDFKEYDIYDKFTDFGDIRYYQNNDLSIGVCNRSAFLSNQNGIKIRHNLWSSAEIFSASNDCIIYTYNFNLSELYSYNMVENNTDICKIPYNSLIGNSKVQLSYFDKQNQIILIGNKASPILGESGDFTSSSQLKYHDYDCASVVDIQNGKLEKEKKFRTFERVIFVDEEKIITYYNNKYCTYDTEIMEIVDERNASEIKNGGSYTFEFCGDYVFVFDDNSGELLNTINVA